MKGYLYVLGFFAAIVVLALLWQVIRFLIKRIAFRLDIAKLGLAIRPQYPLWWLIDLRNRCNVLIEIPDKPDRTLAVKLIPTLLQGSEYGIEADGTWVHQWNFLFPYQHGTMMMNLGYRKCLPRRVNFGCYPDATPVYLFHPHPFAITAGRSNAKKRADGIPIPSQVDGVLLMDMSSLRWLAKSTPSERGAIWNDVRLTDDSKVKGT